MRKSFFLFCIILPVLLSGCASVSTTAIREFTTVSAQATESLPEIAGDLSETCLRAAQYQAMAGGEFDPERLRQKAESDSRCARLQTSRAAFVQANTVLTTYLRVLENLAADKLAVYDKRISGLATDVSGLKALPEAQVTAVKNIVTVLGNAAADGWRRKQLKKAIGAANGDIQTLTQGIKTIVGSDYVQLLAIEEQAARLVYAKAMAEYRDKMPAILIHQQWKNDFNTLQERKKAANAYFAILDTIARGHQTLQDNSKRLKARAVAVEVAQLTAALLPLIKETKEAF